MFLFRPLRPYVLRTTPMGIAKVKITRVQQRTILLPGAKEPAAANLNIEARDGRSPESTLGHMNPQ